MTDGLSAHRQPVGALLDSHFAAAQAVAAVRGSQNVNFGSFRIGGFDRDRAVDSLHFDAVARLKLKTLANFLACLALGIFGRYPHG